MSNYTAAVDGVHMHLENKKMGKFFFWFLWWMYVLVYMISFHKKTPLPILVKYMQKGVNLCIGKKFVHVDVRHLYRHHFQEFLTPVPSWVL